MAAHRSLGHLAEGLRSGWGTLLKPLAWQGDLCFGPSRGTRVTFRRPDQASRSWRGLAEPNEAAPIAIAAYVGAYGPTTAERFGRWLASGWFGKRALNAYFAGMGERLARVEVDGEPAYVLAEHVEALASTAPSKAMRLLPGFDGWVLGPGTDDQRVVPRAYRSKVSRTAGWISPTVVVGGVVAGTWALEKDLVTFTPFDTRTRLPRRELGTEVARLSEILGRDLRIG